MAIADDEIDNDGTFVDENTGLELEEEESTISRFTEPKIYLIAEPSLNWAGISDFLKDEKTFWQTDTTITGDLLPEFAGRVCYVSFGKKQGRTENDEYLRNIINHGHGSVLEHAVYSFLITRVSRGFTHQMVRHRAGFAYSPESTHYIDYSKDLRVVDISQDIEKEPGLHRIVSDIMLKNIQTNYHNVVETLMNQGMSKKEACGRARFMLPIGMESKLFVSGNVRAWRHFIETRGNKHNTPEIHKVAMDIYRILKEKAPSSMIGLFEVDNEIISRNKKV